MISISKIISIPLISFNHSVSSHGKNEKPFTSRLLKFFQPFPVFRVLKRYEPQRKFIKEKVPLFKLSIGCVRSNCKLKGRGKNLIIC